MSTPIGTPGDRPELPEFASRWPECDVPTRTEVLPDGREGVVAGNMDWMTRQAVERTKDWSSQVATWMEKPASAALGDVPLAAMAQDLQAHDVPIRVEFGESIEDLAAAVEQGSIVLAAVNTGIVFDLPHAVGDGSGHSLVAIVGVARAGENANVEGFYIMAEPGAAPQFVPADAVCTGWLAIGGLMAVTEQPMPVR